NDSIRIATPHEFDTGDAVLYRNNEDDSNVGDLLDKQTYFISVGADPSLVRLHLTRDDALAASNPVSLSPVPDFEDRHSLSAERVFDPAAPGIVDGGASTINIGNLVGLEDGEAVKYFNGGGKSIGGLTDGAVYYVNVDDADLNAIKVRLFNSR